MVVLTVRPLITYDQMSCDPRGAHARPTAKTTPIASTHRARVRIGAAPNTTPAHAAEATSTSASPAQPVRCDPPTMIADSLATTATRRARNAQPRNFSST